VLVNPCALSGLPYNHQRKIISRLPTSLPLHISAPFIDEDDLYWKRCCKARWSATDVKQYGGSWKRMAMEKTIESIIENYVPVPAQCSQLEAVIPLAGSIVRRLTLRQLLPPVRVIPDSDTGDYLVLSDTDSTHFDFGQVLPQVSDLADAGYVVLYWFISPCRIYSLKCCITSRSRDQRSRSQRDITCQRQKNHYMSQMDRLTELKLCENYARA